MPCDCRTNKFRAFSFVAEFRFQRCKSGRDISFSEMEIVGNSITETGVAMELCKEVQVEEYVIHVVGSTNFYTDLQSSLLASTWFPRPLGVCLWSALHMLLVLYEALILLVLFPIVFILAVLWDAIIVTAFIFIVVFFPFTVIIVIPVMIIISALVWLWLVITCQCCPLPERAPGQGLRQYIFTAGVTLEGGGFLNMGSLTLRFVGHVTRVSFPYRRAQLGDFCREIVPWCDTIVI